VTSAAYSPDGVLFATILHPTYNNGRPGLYYRDTAVPNAD
jgi:hypothetical protein